MSPVLIDFEASGLGEDSWPVEIGVAWLDRDALGAAPTAETVAREYATLLTGPRLILADAPHYDGWWWRRLAALLDPTPDVTIKDFEVAAFAAFSGSPHALDWVFETCERTLAPHRAGTDARRLAKAWREGVRRMN